MKLLLSVLLFLNLTLYARVVTSSAYYPSSYTRVTISSPSSGSGGGSGGGGGSSSPKHYIPGHGNSHGSGASVPSVPLPPKINIAIGYYYIFSEEDAKKGKVMKFNVAFSKPLASDITLRYTIDTTDNGSGATIDIAKDIKTPAYSVFVKKGSTSVDIPLQVIDDNDIEDAEYFFLNLETPTSSKNRFSFINKQSLGVIIDNDIKSTSTNTNGNYHIFEAGTMDSDIKTKIVKKVAKLDIYAKSGVEVLHNIHTTSNTTCSSPNCFDSTDSSGDTVTTCITDCLTTVTTYYEYSDSMNIKKVLLHRFKDYDTTTKKCSNEDGVLTITKDKTFKSGEKMTITVPTDNAYRCAYIEVVGTSDTVYSTHLPVLYSGVSDFFAIRPKEFKITAPTIQTSAKPFSLKIDALGDDGTKTVNYNQKNNTTYKLKISDKIYGENNISNLGFNISSDFTNGEISKNIKYLEVGKIDINISENPNNYFAIIDNSKSYIKPASKTIEFIADRFSVDYDSKYAKSDLAFISNTLNSIYSYVDLDIQALNADGDVVKRYTNSGYAKDSVLTLTQAITTTNNTTSNKRTLLTENSSDADMPTGGSDKDIVVNFNKNDFLNGKLFNNQIKQTFKREKNVALNPIELFTKKVKIHEKVRTSIKGEKSKNTISSKHYYVRAHIAPDPINIAGDELNANIYYESYCKNCNKNQFPYAKEKASIDSVYWYILPSSSFDDFTCDILPNVTVAEPSHVIDISRKNSQKIHMKVNKIPQSNRVFYTPKYDYLLYDKFNSAVLKHHFDVSFSSAGAKWAGEGELGNTVDTDISKIKNESLEY